LLILHYFPTKKSWYFWLIGVTDFKPMVVFFVVFSICAPHGFHMLLSHLYWRQGDDFVFWPPMYVLLFVAGC
jgi:hypothetical protein